MENNTFSHYSNTSYSSIFPVCLPYFVFTIRCTEDGIYCPFYSELLNGKKDEEEASVDGSTAARLP